MTFCVSNNIIGDTESEVNLLSPRTGRPKSDNPKSIETRIRMDKETDEKLRWCAAQKGMSKSDIIREGIDLVKRQIEAKK